MDYQELMARLQELVDCSKDPRMTRKLCDLRISLQHGFSSPPTQSKPPNDSKDENVCVIMVTDDQPLEGNFLACYPVHDRRMAVSECLRLCSEEILRLFDESRDYTMQIDGDDFYVYDTEKDRNKCFSITDFHYLKPSIQ